MINFGRWNKSWRNIPGIVQVVIIFTLIAVIGGIELFGYQIAGWAWFIPLLAAVWVLIMGHGRIKFPIVIWFPWIALVLIYLSVAEAPNAFQRSIILLCPIVVGIAVSRLKIDENILDRFLLVSRYVTITFFLVIIYKTGILVTGQIPEVTGLAAEAITACLLCSLFAAYHACGNKRALIWWLAVMAIPVVAMTRAPIAAAGLSLPLTFAPMGTMKRVVIFILIGIAAIALFNTQRIQQKMFFSGGGTLSNISLENPDFRTTGRITILNAIISEIELELWFGHGANVSEQFVSDLTGGIKHPHNDWLRLAYDYGYVGTALFAVSMVLQVIHAWWRAKRSSGAARVLFYTGASSFLPFSLLMLTDNIILYAAFFGNLQFTIIGLAYATTVPKRRRNVPYGSRLRS